MSLTAGDTLGPYEVVEPIGRGGMVEVYHGHQAAGDGQRFLVARRSASSEAAITIVLNWQSSIER